MVHMVLSGFRGGTICLVLYVNRLSEFGTHGTHVRESVGTLRTIWATGRGWLVAIAADIFRDHSVARFLGALSV